MRKIKLIAFLTSVASCLVLFGVGYSSWYVPMAEAQTSSSGSIQTYGVMDSNEWYALTENIRFDALFADTDEKLLFVNLSNFDATTADSSSVKLTYTKQTDTPSAKKLTAKIMFGDQTTSTAFFGAVAVSSVAVEGGTAKTTGPSNGVYEVVVEGNPNPLADTVSITITLTSKGDFDSSFAGKSFSIKTIIE